MFQQKSFLWSHRPDLIFDGSDPSLSFAEFIRSIDVVLDMAHERADDVLPTFLYGDALRFYETLDQECQHSWEKLRDVMCGRFPGEVKTLEAAVRRWWEYHCIRPLMTSFEELLQTPAYGPPVGTTSRLTPSPTGVAEEKIETNASAEVVGKGLKHKKSDIWLGKLKDRLRIPSFARGAKSDNVVDPSNAS